MRLSTQPITSLRRRREGLGLTQRALARKLGIEASYVALIESGRSKPSLNLVARLADTLGIERREVFVLTHPEARALLETDAQTPPHKTTRSWQRFIKNRQLLTRYYVTKRELRALEHLSWVGTQLSSKEYLTILTLVRDIPVRK